MGSHGGMLLSDPLKHLFGQVAGRCGGGVIVLNQRRPVPDRQRRQSRLVFLLQVREELLPRRHWQSLRGGMSVGANNHRSVLDLLRIVSFDDVNHI